MRKLFKVFEGYEQYNDVLAAEKRAPVDVSGARYYTLADLGREFIYSEAINFNQYCRTWRNNLGVYPMSAVEDPYAYLDECAKYASAFSVPGFISLHNDETGEVFTLAENAYTNAYNGINRRNCFFVLFNARPMSMQCSNNIVTFGYDKYSIVYEPNSIIVWNLDRYIDWHQNDYRLWGIRQDTMTQYSVTDDVLLTEYDGFPHYACES